MMRTLTAAVASVLLVATTALIADEHDKKTTITVNNTIMIPGKTLPPGKYVIKLMESSSNRNIVQIFNEEQNKLEATILAFNNYRLEPKDKTVIEYWETPSGSPPALRAWFFPGDNYGQEFAYPKSEADKIAKANSNARVASYSASESPKPEELAALKVDDTPSELQKEEPAPAPAPAANSVAAQPERVVSADENRAPAVVAQAAPPPATTPAPRADSAPAPAPAPSSELPSTELPSTATRVPLIGLIGLAMLGAAAVLRLRSAL